ncbi:MAG: ring-opening amidohydrolase [Candidatus Obscuribacterales bacterium]|nr:ring-opening amidohydrolase [Candidatus Obscuribacterales bacterium]
MQVKAIKIATSSPADVSQLARYMDDGTIDPAKVICIIGKTEGNGGRNDFTRDLAMLAFESLFSEKLGISRQEVVDRIIFSLSGGCEGVVSPHIVVFSRSGEPTKEKNKEKRLAVGTGFTRAFAPGEIGRMAQVEETARVIMQIVSDLKVDSNSDVHFIQMKGAIPKFTYEEGLAAAKAGKPIRSDMVFSRGASALAAALALGEVDAAQLNDDIICNDWNLFSSTASCSAKPGLERTEIMVMANSPYWDGDLMIEHGVLKDMLDTKSVVDVLAKLKIDCNLQLTPKQAERLVGVFAKSEADPRGTIHGRRATMLTDDDISDTRYSRCVLGAVLSSVLYDPAIYISTRAEHHGPAGGGTLAIIAKQDK